MGGDVAPETRVQWIAALGDGAVSVSGTPHRVGDLQGQPVESVLTLPVPADANLPPGDYPVRLRLLDAATSRPLELSLPDGSRTQEWPLGSVTAYSSPRCEPEESAL